MNAGTKGFQENIRQMFANDLQQMQSLLPRKDCLKIDLHCHDLNSDQPSVPLGRMMGVRETWIETETLIETQRKNGATAHTITNHNNARSCFELQDQGFDILTGAEFDCLLDDEIGLHVLTFGFTPSQEERLRKLGKRSVYKFLEYTLEHEIATVLAHPLYVYDKFNKPLPLDAWEKLALLFERFEVLNGQRDCWQNKLTMDWLQAMTPERLESLSKKHGIALNTFCSDPYVKRFCGGSDDHMGFLSGCTGTLIHVPNLATRLTSVSSSDLVKEALLQGQLAPYGQYGDPRKMGTAFIDYFCQLLIHLDDPGLIRLLLHRGSSLDKILAFITTNLLFEMRRHKYTSHFLNAFHDALQGKKINFLNKLLVAKEYRAIVNELNQIAQYYYGDSNHIHDKTDAAITNIYYLLVRQINKKLAHGLSSLEHTEAFANLDFKTLINQLEVPLSIRSLLTSDRTNTHRKMTQVNLGDLVDRLSFPILMASIIVMANFISSHVMFSRRKFLNQFSHQYAKLQPPKKALWLTDTFDDHNGVSFSLQEKLKEIQQQNLAIDLLVCHPTLSGTEHLKIMQPLGEYKVPFYPEQIIRIPDLIELQKLFFDGGYDRIICSTEGSMGLAGLYLKYAFNVPMYFFMHTHWVEFAKQSLNFEKKSLDRLRRLLRLFYHKCEGIFVLNQDDKKWLTGKYMNIAEERVFLTSHWIDQEVFSPKVCDRETLFPGLSAEDKILLYVGRLSAEKGLPDLLKVFKKIKTQIPSCRLVVIGKGPYLEIMQREISDLIYLGWVAQKDLCNYYSAADLLVLPSTFDTFGRVVLEAISCGLPVSAYNSKGPKEIIKDQYCGLLCKNRTEMAKRTSNLLLDKARLNTYKKNALTQAKCFNKNKIMKKLTQDMELLL